MATEWGNMGDNMGDMEVSNPWGYPVNHPFYSIGISME
jgi:hypothetical protein